MVVNMRVFTSLIVFGTGYLLSKVGIYVMSIVNDILDAGDWEDRQDAMVWVDEVQAGITDIDTGQLKEYIAASQLPPLTPWQADIFDKLFGKPFGG